MTAQFLGYLTENKYRNDYMLTAVTSEIDFDFKRLDTLQAALEDIYEQDGLEINMGLPEGCRDSKAFDILIARLKEAADAFISECGCINSCHMAEGRASQYVYEDADDYIAEVVKKIERRIERDDYQWEWECFVESLQGLIDELVDEAHRRNPGMPRPDHIHVAARNIGWRGRSGMLVCEADATKLLQKVTGTHNSPSYHFYWGDQVNVVDDYGNAVALSEKKYLHMVMPHHDATTHADIEAVWMDHLGEPVSESELDSAKNLASVLQDTTRRIYGADRYDRMFGEKHERPAVYHLVSFERNSVLDEDVKLLGENTAAEHMDSLSGDLWFWVRQNCGEETDVYKLTDEYRHTTVAHYVSYPEVFRDLTMQVIEAIEKFDSEEV